MEEATRTRGVWRDEASRTRSLSTFRLTKGKRVHLPAADIRRDGKSKRPSTPTIPTGEIHASGISNHALLETQKLCAGYGRNAVIHDVDLSVASGEVVAILGPNGAGKTTTLLALSGEILPLSGELLVDGEAVRQPLHRRARNGLSFVTEERSVFMAMSMIDNLRAGRVDPEAVLQLFPELRERTHVRGGLLSGGEQQMLTLGRAIQRRPRVLLADELSLGLAPLVVRRLLDAVRRAADEGCGVIIVEQHIRQALRIADRAYVMQRGNVVMTGTASELLSRIDEIESKYLS